MVSACARIHPGDDLSSNGSTEDERRDHRQNQQEQGPRPGKKNKERQARKSALHIASLNINGFGNLVRDHPDNKWGRIYRMMSENRIGVLLLQETHLTEERKASIHEMFARKIKILHSANPDAPTQREGVAVVLNARYIDTAGAKATVIVPGRAIQVKLQCPGGDTRHILCVYAPTSNGVAERKAFYDDVRSYYEAHPRVAKPDLMAGDFNNVEDAIDRLPIGDGPDQSILALDDLKLSLGLMLADGWRITNPTMREYTFHHGTGRQAIFSRLDRIYVNPKTFDNARNWRICEAGVRTDHSLIMVQLTSEKAPIIGPGRPLFPLLLLKDRTLTKQIRTRGLEAMRELAAIEMAGGRTETSNPQRILCRLKADIMRLARERERAVVPKLLAEIRECELALKRVKADRNLPEDRKVAEAESLTKQVRQLKQRRVKQQQQNSRATHRLFGDRPTKYWSKLHRECAPRDIIPAFEIEGRTGVSGEKIYESDSAKMAEMARRHHMNVQKDEPDSKHPDERETDIRTALDSLDVTVTGTQGADLGGEITYEEVAMSLRFSKNGTAPGIDGMPFEVWKTLHARHTEDLRFPDRPNFDLVLLLKEAFEDMRTHGVDESTSFAQGWIAPIYKEKGERTKVVNYRPITLLNTDYKLLSKSLAVRLAAVAPNIIHKAQAGFVPGRRIHNHTQLARMMMHWAEENEADGAIVALDQEKAYDKIAHDYLWRVLERFEIPGTTIELIKALYKNAKTSIMINGILSNAYRVYRGVRQGDPLSCLLFDLAIEPLSAMIRKSDLKGFNIPRSREVLKAVLFADDTTVYLSCQDDFKTLQDVLDTWCSAAKARFNIAKTEIIPIGSPAFRNEMAETYRETGAWKNYPRNVHVAQDGEAIRILGAFFGNGIDQINVWTLVLTKIVAMRKPLTQVMERWKAGHTTIQGKKHVVQMIVGGMTQYLTTVQRMPDDIVKRLTKIIRGYLWDDRHNTPVGMEHVRMPVNKGGLNLLDLEARNEAIDIMWLKSYLDFSDARPTWAFLADDLFASLVTKSCRPKRADLRMNSFLQRWKPRVRGLPAELAGMMGAARKFGLRVEGLAFSKDIINAMPMWDHLYADRIPLGRLTVPSRLLSCLQDRHALKTVGDFNALAQVLENATHRPRLSCECTDCTRLKAEAGCLHPHLCSTRAKEILNTLPGKWDPRGRHAEDHERANMEVLSRENLADDLVPFDRSITTHGNLGDVFRIFTSEAPVSNERTVNAVTENGTAVTISTDGSCLRNGERNAQAGAGVYVEENQTLNQSLRLPDWIEQSNQTGEIVAALLAATTVSSQTRIIHETDSRTTIDSMTKWRKRHEDAGYILQRNVDLTRATIARLRARNAHTLFRWVKGHSGQSRNEAADALAAIGAESDVKGHLDLDIPLALRVTGAKLSAMTQKLAYRAIRSRKDAHTIPRPRAETNLDRISSGVQAAYGIQIHNESIWSSFRSRHITRSTSQFLWMAVHDGYMIGTHWRRPSMSAELQARATCSICGETETMSHIILECNAVGQDLIWDLLKQTWTLTKAEWHQPSWGTTIGAANAVFKTAEGARKTAIENLWCILSTEAVHLIWKLRCERVIQREGADFSVAEVTNRFYAAIDSRLNLDRRTAAISRGRRALKPRDIGRIWHPILENMNNLPARWVTDSGVLVGIKRGR